eukprot:TRINITY_DN2122_c0_g1_i1.p1 TRINITY_DN2122_c0_g1~~TRINITY_DN2122_c0_g1_i1.p1  ORF type:complete len:205 (+),score=23.55 TRINITY_DN2122_c0_g1_i1:632-1246(+)
MIGKFKLACGAQATAKLEGMITDMRTAISHQRKFASWLEKSKRDLGYDFVVQVLTSSFWPAFDDSAKEMKVPSAFSGAIKAFGKFWELEQQKRNLKWIHSLGTVTLRGSFDAKPVQIQCSTIQASVMLLLNRTESITIADAIELIKVAPDELKRQLKPLCSKKFGVLRKDPQKGYNVAHQLSMNRAWNPPRTRVRIPLVVQKDL